MKISKNSWHYKLMDKMEMLYDRKDLCSYIRGLVIIILTPLYLLSAPFMLYYGMLEVPYISSIYETIIYSIFVSAGAIGSTIDIVFIIALLSGLLLNSIKGDIKEKEKKKVDEPNKPNIFGEYIKAKKNKICPLIEFE